MIQHILPVNDLHEHSEDIIDHLGLIISKCPCQPKIEFMYDNYVVSSVIVIHSSFDGREAVEEFNEIMNKLNNNT